MSGKRAQRDGELPPPAERLPSPVADSHCHLDIVEGTVPGFGVDDQLSAAEAVNVTRLVAVGVDLETSRWCAAEALTRPNLVATVAIHPNEAARGVSDDDMAVLAELAAQPQVRGIGETGLDFFRTTGAEELRRQEESFRRHIQLAKSSGKALVIHDRDAHAAVLRVLASEGAPERVVFHCFSGDADFAGACIDAGYVLSFAGTVTFANAHALREAAAITPAGQMLVETDAPFLTPVPYRGRPNASTLVPLTVRTLAAQRAIDLDDLCNELATTTTAVFGAF